MRPFDARLLRSAPAARGPLLLLLGLGIAAGLVAIWQAFAVAGLILAVVEPERAGRLPLAAALVIAAFTSRGLLAGVGEAVASHAGARVATQLRQRLAEAALTGPHDGTGATRFGPDRTLTLFTQGASSVEPYVARYLPTLVAAAFLPVAVIIAMATLDPITALIPVLTVPLLPFFAALIGSSTADETQRRWRTLAQLSGHFLDVMRGLPVLVAYGRARRQARVVRDVSEQHRRATVATLRLAFVSSAALELLATISVAIVAVWVGIHLAIGEMALSVALPLILLAPEAYWPIRRVGAEFHNAADGATALGDIAQALEPPTGSGTGEAGTSTGISTGTSAETETTDDTLRAVELSFRYQENEPWVLNDLDLVITPGLTVITGPSGSGKTTLLELLAGVRTPTRGVVRRPAGASLHLVTQRPFLIAGSMRENFRLGEQTPRIDAEIAAACQRVGLHELIDDNVNPGRSLDAWVGDDGFGLSAGQRARLAVARAWLCTAHVVLLDEPTAHLDPVAERAVHDVLLELAQTRIVVAVSHRPGLIGLAQQLIDLPASEGTPVPAAGVSAGTSAGATAAGDQATLPTRARWADTSATGPAAELHAPEVDR